MLLKGVPFALRSMPFDSDVRIQDIITMAQGREGDSNSVNESLIGTASRLAVNQTKQKVYAPWHSPLFLSQCPGIRAHNDANF